MRNAIAKVRKSSNFRAAIFVPEWLRYIGETIPFDSVAQIYCTVIIGGNFGFPISTFLAIAGIGLALICFGSWIVKAK